MLSRDQWESEVDLIFEEYYSGAISVNEAGDRLLNLGFSPRETREMLQEDTLTNIPKDYFGEEKSR